MIFPVCVPAICKARYALLVHCSDQIPVHLFRSSYGLMHELLFIFCLDKICYCEMAVVILVARSQRSFVHQSQFGGLSKKKVSILQKEALFQTF